MSDWDGRWLEVAKTYASFSKDPSSKIGAAIVQKNRVVAAGWNGFPRGIWDDPHRLNDRPKKYSLMVHAEMNAIFNAAFTGSSTDGATLYVYGLPCCAECAKGVIQAGIKRVVMLFSPSRMDGPWGESFNRTVDMFKEAEVEFEIRFIDEEKS